MSLAKNPKQYRGVRAILPPDLQLATRNPTSSDKAYIKGTLWLNTAGSTSFMWPGTGNWIALGSGASGGVVTINSNAPVGGNYVLAPTANQIAITQTAGTSTFTIPAAFIAPGSIASTTTITSGTSLAATTSVTAGTTLTATLGNITATNGNVVLGTAGNKQVYTSVAATSAAGANSAGTVALVAGTVVVATTAVGAASQVRLTCQALGTVTAPSALCVSAKSAGVSFTILASQGTDTSTIFWEIVN